MRGEDEIAQYYEQIYREGRQRHIRRYLQLLLRWEVELVYRMIIQEGRLISVQLNSTGRLGFPPF
jgi:hypothetical protein